MARSTFVRSARLAAALVALGIVQTAGAQAPGSEATPQHMEGYRGRWPFHLALGGGITAATGDFGDLFDMGFNGQASFILKKTTWPVGLRVDGLYSRHELKSGGVAAPGGTSVQVANDGVGHIGAFTANLVLPFRTGGISPYLVGGGGIYTTRFKTDASAAAEHKVNGGFDVGGGFAFHLPAIVDGYIEARFHSFNPKSDLFGKDSFQIIPITVGIVW
jgi:hypothetical protein